MVTTPKLDQRKRGRKTDTDRGLELLRLFRVGGPIDFDDHPLAQRPDLQRLAQERHPSHPFRNGLVARWAIKDSLLAIAGSLEDIPTQARLRGFILALAAGSNMSVAASAAGVSREWASRRLVKVTSRMLVTLLDARFQ